MPNWCCTDITFYSNDGNLLIEYQKKLQEIYDANATVENGFGNGWLGDFVNTLLAPDYTTEIENIRCRGMLLDTPDSNQVYFCEGCDHYVFYIHAETAWAPMMQMWDLILEKYSNGRIKMAYVAEEGGCELYQTYDPEGLFNYPRFKLDYNIGDYDSYECHSLDELKKHIYDIEELKILPSQLDNMNSEELATFLESVSESLDEDEYIFFHEYIEAEEYYE